MRLFLMERQMKTLNVLYAICDAEGNEVASARPADENYSNSG